MVTGSSEKYCCGPTADRQRTEGMTTTVRRLAFAIMSGVAYTPVSVEVAALDVLHRAGGKPVTRDAVARWFDDRSRHAGRVPVLAMSGREEIEP